jgi:hypothetical protein
LSLLLFYFALEYNAFTDQAWTCHFPAPCRNCCNIGKFILLFLRNDTRLVSRKPRSAWRWVMWHLPGAGSWQLHLALSANALSLVTFKKTERGCNWAEHISLLFVLIILI